MAMPRLPVLSGCSARMARPRLGAVAGAGDALGAEGLHEGAAIGLAVEADLHHEDDDLEAEHGARQRQRRAPLPGTGLGGDALDALFFVVERLRNGGVRLVAAGRAHALVLVVDARRGIQRPLQPPGAEQRRRAPLPIDVAHRLRDLDLALGAHLLLDHRAREDHRQVVRGDRLLGAGMQHRGQRLGQIGVDVVPGLGQVFFVEQVFDAVAHDGLRGLRLVW